MKPTLGPPKKFQHLTRAEEFITRNFELVMPRLRSTIQYIPRNMHTVFALLCFVVVIHWLIFPYPSGLLHWHCGNLTIAPVPAKPPWWIWINTSCEFIKNDCITTTKQNTTKPCTYFLGYTVPYLAMMSAAYLSPSWTDFECRTKSWWILHNWLIGDPVWDDSRGLRSRASERSWILLHLYIYLWICMAK